MADGCNAVNAFGVPVVSRYKLREAKRLGLQAQIDHCELSQNDQDAIDLKARRLRAENARRTEIAAVMRRSGLSRKMVVAHNITLGDEVTALSLS